ncbi:MAG: acyl-CoA thioesterase II [Gammaproteobacteria bacterium]|uniref:acyl-CoA thioesterase domain-containing protein n=1 Tax=Pseudomaricurvus alcaniphilus TaxID=1166482 RepID=UPI001408E0D5|nr:acyl-CoA thioesterase II [Gammaproteobacteria bacterium]NHN35702.1 acyl-CoA thioesterase II [Pseudomaricurvus alcaniphilus]
MTQPTARLYDLLEVEQLDTLLFRSPVTCSELPHVYGGQVLAQALNAAIRTVPAERQIHSLHGYFLRAGDIDRPIIYDVDPIRDGGSFTTRRVVAKQKGKAIFNAALSFQIPEQGFEHQAPMPAVPPADSLVNDAEVVAELRQAALQLPPRVDVFGAFETRTNGDLHILRSKSPEARHGYWIKTVNPLADDPVQHLSILAYASDYVFMATAMIPHDIRFGRDNLQAASLDHAMWFHAPFRVDQWLYYDMESPVASGGRGLNFGRFYDQAGRLVASTAQEGLMRKRSAK